MHIIIKNMKQFLRDKGYVFWTTLFPILLIFILSTMLAPMYQDEQKAKPLVVDIVNNSSDEKGIDAFFGFFDELENQDLITYSKSSDLDMSQTLLSDDKIQAVIKLSGDNMKIDLIKNNYSIETRIIESLIKGYVENEKTIQSIIATNPSLLSNMNYEMKSLIDNSEGSEGFAILDYYGIAMIVMTMFMISFLTSFEYYHKEKDDKTLIRLKLSPKNQFMMFIQTNISAIFQSLFQVVIMMAASVIILDVTYCDNILDNILLFSMLSIATAMVISLGSLLAVLLKKSFVGILNMIIWAMLFFSGTFAKEVIINGFSNFMPPYIIQQAAFDLTLYGRSSNAIIVIIVCTVLFLVFSLLGAKIFAKKEIEL